MEHDNILRYGMELEMKHTENEDQGVSWIKYFAKVERRNGEKGLVLGGWRIYFLLEVQYNNWIL